MKFTDEDEINRLKEIESVKKKLNTYFKDSDIRKDIDRIDIRNIESIMKDLITKTGSKIDVENKTFTQITDIITTPIKDTKIYTTEFKENINFYHDLDKIKSIFKDELKALNNVEIGEVHNKEIEKMKKEKKLHILSIKFSIDKNKEDQVRIPIENILKEGGSNSLFNYAELIDNIIAKVSNDKETLISDIVSKINGEISVRKSGGSIDFKSQISHLLKKIKNIIVVKYSYKSPEASSRLSNSNTDKRFQKKEIIRFIEGFNKLEKNLAKPELGGDTSISPETSPETLPGKKTEAVAVSKQVDKVKKKNVKGTETQAYSRKNTNSETRYNTEDDDADDDGEENYEGTDEGDDGGDDEGDDEGDDDDKTEKNGESYLDTLFSYFNGGPEKDETSTVEEKNIQSPENIIKSLDVTGLFSKDKSFVPNDTESRKIEITESELQSLQDSEEQLKQELAEQTNRIREYKRDIQNKISQQYALLDYERKQLLKDGKIYDFNKRDKYYRLVDMLRNRERFLDKREEILNKKREKDIKELDKEKKKIVSQLLKQLNKEKNIIIKNKNRENDILKKHVAYYKQNNKDLESMVDRLDNCNGKDKKQIEKKKRTIRKRKQNRMKNYTDSGLFEITL
jgi:hypothetical protein